MNLLHLVIIKILDHGAFLKVNAGFLQASAEVQAQFNFRLRNPGVPGVLVDRAQDFADTLLEVL